MRFCEQREERKQSFNALRNDGADDHCGVDALCLAPSEFHLSCQIANVTGEDNDPSIILNFRRTRASHHDSDVL